MKLIDWLLLGAVVLVVGGVVFYLLKRKKAGKGGCGCGCAGCPSAGACGRAKKENDDDETV